MKREDLAAMGLTEEQIEKVIAENGKDVQTANAKATKNNAELERLQGIEKEFNAMKDQNLSEQEKAAKQLEEANKRIAELEKAHTLATQRTSAADKFKITSEQAAQVVKDDGSFDFDVLGKIISDKETAAAQAKEQEIANGTTNPGGGSAGGNDGTESKGAEMAKKYNQRYVIEQ
jgi:anion-transporting  ArsA/GET3 family ATPase